MAASATDGGAVFAPFLVTLFVAALGMVKIGLQDFGHGRTPSALRTKGYNPIILIGQAIAPLARRKTHRDVTWILLIWQGILCR
jgi:hypothetical protein